MTPCGGLVEPKRPDRGDPDGGDSENGSCENNDRESTRSITQGQSEATKHPTFNLPSPFKAIDLRTIFKDHSLVWVTIFYVA